LARDLIGYPEELLDIFWRGDRHTVAQLIDVTSDGAAVLDSAKQFFRTKFANTA
jgi:hypothetical protein